ncbi:Rho termination factor N-terminal domain-containing protein [Gemmata sp. JC717]|uniref:Rho termination factor N-terminal domain-containing protein n=1 Tax=Gemmata algarum TaxID=2975278 RepID=UPI0021BB9327|nr:Rho termination factor N-terminal domain-containing protein [Gemmata algarum]MDY3555310.1 Rho termination factor N-terminal domain-containing protein [Gemmata algarum]
MKPEHKRIVDLAAGWEDSRATVTLSPADALLLTSVGAKVVPGKRAIDPVTITAPELCDAAAAILAGDFETPEGAEPTPNQQSVSPGPVAPPVSPVVAPPVVPPVPPVVAPTVPPKAPEEGDKLEELTVAELRNLATDRGLTVPSNAVKAAIIEAIRKAPK